MKAIVEVNNGKTFIERVVHFAVVEQEIMMCVKIQDKRVEIIDKEFDDEGMTTIYRLGRWIDK